MSEWLKAHAWKATPLARADAHQIPPTHLRSTTSITSVRVGVYLQVTVFTQGFRVYVTQF